VSLIVRARNRVLWPQECLARLILLANVSHDLDSPASIFFGIDLGRPHVLVGQDDPGGLDAKPLPDLGRRGMAELMRVPLRDACFPARDLDRA